jgi:CheY-like chemotaxis protein
MDLETTHPAAESVDQILTASRRAAQLVEQILTFARVERAELRRINPLPVVEESVRLLRSTLPAGVQLALLKGGELPAILADETQLQQVLINLGTNAWHALEGGAGRISVELSAETVDATLAAGCRDLSPGDYLRIRVEDTGHGMPPAVLERIFEPFFTTKEVGKGTGLGLSVVHGIVRSHGGAIAVQSAVGVGTTFDLFLPAAAAEAGPDGQTQEVSLRMGHGEQVLLVDDQPEMLRTNRRELERLGYRVVAFTDSGETLARFKAAPADFALLLTDLNMPGLNGVELTRAILRLKPGLPVILTSGFITEDLRLAALGAGVREVLRKPATLQELSDAVARHLSPSA